MVGRRTGFVTVDVLMGLMLVGTLTAALTVAAGRHGSAAQRLSDSRAAVRLAEAVLLDLSNGAGPGVIEPLKDAEAEEGGEREVAIRAMEAESAPAPAGIAWIEVRVRVGRGSAELVGLVPDEALNAWREAGVAIEGEEEAP